MYAHNVQIYIYAHAHAKRAGSSRKTMVGDHLVLKLTWFKSASFLSPRRVRRVLLGSGRQLWQYADPPPPP